MNKRYERYKKWLASHNPEGCAGITGKADACPISHFLEEITIYDQVHVHTDRLDMYDSMGRWIKDKVSEEWMTIFVQQIDQLKPGHQLVTYAECLQIIAEMEAK